MPSNPSQIHIPYLTVITISGLDAEKLLQGQSSCDVAKLNNQHAALGTLSTAKGKMYANFLLLKDKSGNETDFLMVLHNDLAEKVVTQLKKYAVFYKCNIHKAEDLFVNTDSIAQQTPLTLTYENDYTHINWLNQHNMVISNEPGKQDSLTSWQHNEYQAGWFWLNSDACEAYTAPMLNMDKLNAISFDKGCYTGQEVIARTHYKGTLKKRLQLLSCEDAVNTEFKQAIIDDQDKNIGHVISSIKTNQGSFIFALLKIETNELFLQQSNNNKKLQIENLPYTVE